jgi:hypothetical protein
MRLSLSIVKDIAHGLHRTKSSYEVSHNILRCNIDLPDRPENDLQVVPVESRIHFQWKLPDE